MKMAHCWEAEEITVIHVRCPYCKKHLDIDFPIVGVSRGDEAKCYACNKIFVLGRENAH